MMRSRVKIISVVVCAVVLVGCMIGYSGTVSQLYFDICSPSSCSLINSYEAKEVWTIPAEEASEFGYGSDEELVAIEITYELYNPVNDRITFTGNLCNYYDENGEWILVYEAAGNYSEISEYENRRILPPGEQAVFKDYVVVPKGMSEIHAYGRWGTSEEVVIKL